MKIKISSLLACFIFLLSQLIMGQVSTDSLKISTWLTNADRSKLFTEQDEKIIFGLKKNWGPTIVIDDRQEYQSVDGFGFALTGGSAEHLIKMRPEARKKILTEIFAGNDKNIGVSYLRLTVGASDLNSFVFSYNDLPQGETDYELKKFDLVQDKIDVIPVMKEILAINPDVKILASPWSAPAWMKENNDIRGGHLKKDCYKTYALYFVKYIQAMAKEGINIDALTIQNEPLNSRNTPSMPWFVEEQMDFIKNFLIPAFKENSIATKLVLFDHNCDRIDYPLALLNDPDISQVADGSGFHHYAGDLGALSKIHLARPDKNVYFTEQMITEKPGSPDIAIASRVKRMIVDVMRNWSRNVILWNLAADPLDDPHTDNGGCSMCQGAITIDGDNISRNIAYYTIAHGSKFVTQGSLRIYSTNTGDEVVSLTEDEERPGILRAEVTDAQVLPNVAFKRPDGKIVLVVANTTSAFQQFNVQYKGLYATLKLQPGAAATYIW